MARSQPKPAPLARILRVVKLVRGLAWLAPAAFIALAAVLGTTGLVSWAEAARASLAVTIAFGPSGWIAPSGWRRRAAEAVLVAVALALTLTADVGMRATIVPPLAILAALAATAAAWREGERQGRLPLLLGTLTAAGQAASAATLFSGPETVLAVLLAGLLAGATARLAGSTAALPVSLLLTAVPLATLPPWLLLAGTAAALASLRFPASRSKGERLVGWLPLALAIAMIGTGPGGAGLVGPSGVPSLLAIVVAAFALCLAVRLPPAVVGAVTLAAVVGVVRPQPAAPQGASVVLSAGSSRAALAANRGGPYLVEIALAHAGELAQGTPVATLRFGGTALPLRAGIETAEWAHERSDVRAVAAHALPRHPIWRWHPETPEAIWGVAGRLAVAVPIGTRPSIERSVLLPPETQVAVAAGPPQRPDGRDWGSERWLLAAAIAVALIQLAARTWTAPTSWLPWSLLVALGVAARLPVEPLRSCVEAFATEWAVAAVVAAWLPAGRRWLALQRPFAAALALLLPLAAFAPHLAPPLGDDNYHLLLMESLVRDGDLRVANNYDLQRYPNQEIYRPFDGTFVHSPVLALLLAPGFALAGRSGAGVLMALAGSALFALALRRARALGIPAGRTAILGAAVLLTYPLITFSTQLWTEIPGALLALACVTPLAAPRLRGVLAAGFTVVAALLKTRLVLAVLPPAVAGWWGVLRRRRVLSVTLIAVVTAAVAWLLVGAVVGNPLDPMGRRRLGDLLPHDPLQPLQVLGGLAFDAAGGLGFAAPVLLAGLAGAAALWRRGGAGERGLLLGGVATVLALLHAVEWRGGDSPPARYLVALWGPMVLALGMLLIGHRRWRSLLWLFVPPSLVVSWVAITRPASLVNIGDGSFWLSASLSRRLGADVVELFPSFLRISPATWLVPFAAVVSVAALAVTTRWGTAPLRVTTRATVAVWLLLGTALLAVANAKTDRRVEVEDPQVVHLSGSPEPPAGAFSRFLVPNGWRIGDGEGVVVPLRLPANAKLRLEGWLEGEACSGATLLVRYDSGEERAVTVRGTSHGAVRLPDPPGAGKVSLAIRLAAPAGGSAVLDRIAVEAP